MKKSQKNAPDAALTDFGFRQVPTAQKQALVRGVFDTVAARYDLMNDLMSGGLHRVWKRRLVEILFLRRNPSHATLHMADIAGGTGDIAFRAARAAARVATPLSFIPGPRQPLMYKITALWLAKSPGDSAQVT